ncbi:MAG: isoaspartyl peptidase/L-asparaginase family protein [Candidatus Binatia bacterium]
MNNHRPAIIVHGGAGSVSEAALPIRLEGCKQAALVGWEQLAKGASALDAVERSLVVLEDNPTFNAGTGSTLNSLGQVEMDAAIMDGRSLSGGAVAAVRGIKNPIKLARKVLEDGRHVLLAGDGALLFAQQSGIPQCSPESLIVRDRRRERRDKHGTVGCVALDRAGGIVAGTSTGGIFNKLPGRVGDSAALGCGIYADEVAGVSCTGMGEGIIRTVMAKTALDMVRSKSHPLTAAKRAITLLEKKTGSRAGVIIIDHRGRFGYARNTERMPMCLIADAAHITTQS